MTRGDLGGERRAQFDRAQFRARLAVVAVLTVGLAVLPQAGPNGPIAAVIVGVGATSAHFIARWITGVPNPTGWLDLIALVTGTAAAAVEPTVWPAALLFQMLVLGGAVSFLPPVWTLRMGSWSVLSMTAVAIWRRPDAALSMLVVAAVFLPVLLSGARRKQARIKRAAHRMEAVAESLPMVVWEWDVTAARMSAVVGRALDVYGRPVAELLERGIFPDVEPDDRARLSRRYADLEVGADGEPVVMEYRYTRPDGRVAWLRDQAARTRGHDGPVIRGVTLDVTESRANELDLHRHRQIVERMPALTVVLDGTDEPTQRAVLQVADPIGWGGVDDAIGLSFGEAFPSLAASPLLLGAMTEIGAGGVAKVGPWPLTDGACRQRTVEAELFPLPGRSIALLISDVTEREEMMSLVRHQARHDDLTGLLNRAALLQLATDALAAGRRCCLLLVDLNDFKSINDTLGHLTGDHYLAVIARRMGALARQHEFVTRLGGDEFAMLVVDPPDERIAPLVDDVVAACREPVTLNGVALAGSASVGVAEGATAESAESLLRRADLAMYHAKVHRQGASRYDPSMERSTDPLRLLGRLGQGFRDNEFVMHYQPKVDATTGRTVSFEALVRWEHPQLGILQPGAFLDLVAVSGHLDTLGGIAVRAAANALAALPDEIAIAVNVTAQNLRNLAFPGMCEAVFAEVGVDLRRLIVEVTESHVLDASGVTHRVIAEMAALGISVSVDDFGTGYSSLTHLRSLPLSELKIDQRFVKDLVDDEQDLVIVRSMIDLGHNLGLLVVAEGVEDSQTLDLLSSLGCDVVQGYHLGRPQPLAQAIERCRREADDAAALPIAGN